jgi:hypothetical protein
MMVKSYLMENVSINAQKNTLLTEVYVSHVLKDVIIAITNTTAQSVQRLISGKIVFVLRNVQLGSLLLEITFVNNVKL